MATSSLVLFNKPYGVQSQFRDDSNNNHTTLSQYFTDKSLRVAGRLDATSEGLLILTSDGRVNKAITQPPSQKTFHQNKYKQDLLKTNNTMDLPDNYRFEFISRD